MTFFSFALELGRLMVPQLAVLIVLCALCDFAVGKLNVPRPPVLAVLWLFLLIETLNVGSRVTLFFQNWEFQIPKVSLGIQLVLLAVLVGLPAAKYFAGKKFANCGAVSKALALFFHTYRSFPRSGDCTAGKPVFCSYGTSGFHCGYCQCNLLRCDGICTVPALTHALWRGQTGRHPVAHSAGQSQRGVCPSE